MIKLYLYPGLFGLKDNNPFGLKVATFLSLVNIEHSIEHLMDTSKAPRNQLPFMKLDGKTISDSNHMIETIIERYQLTIDLHLSEKEKAIAHAVKRMLDENLYWVMSYSRWQDDQYWPQFEKAFIDTFPQVKEGDLDGARNYNFERYQKQGIGRYTPEEVYAKGLKDLQTVETLLNDQSFFFGKDPHTIDACIYGFLANIYYYPMDTPLKNFLNRSQSLPVYIEKMHAAWG